MFYYPILLGKNQFISMIYWLFFLGILAQMPCVKAQIIIEEEGKRLYYERTRRIEKFVDMKDMRDILHIDKFLLGKNRISGNFSYNTGRVLINDVDGEKLNYEIRNAVGIYTRFRFLEEFSVNTTFYIDFNPAASARWISNFTYSIGRYNWRPKKFNFGYENYINNRYSDTWKVLGEKFWEGYYFLSYNHNLDEKKISKIILDETTNFKITYFARYAMRYRDPDNIQHGGLLSGKTTLGAGFRYTIIKKIYIESAVYYYPEAKLKKQPWDPDFTYGFGYFDWRSFRFSITYGNWVINRFPWNEKFYPHYGFFDGNFKVLANWTW